MGSDGSIRLLANYSLLPASVFLIDIAFHLYILFTKKKKSQVRCCIVMSATSANTATDRGCFPVHGKYSIYPTAIVIDKLTNQLASLSEQA